MLDKRISPVYLNKFNFVAENLDKFGTVLDVGCGDGCYFELYKKNSLNFFGIDINSKLLLGLNNVICSDLQNIPFKSSTFDTVICVDVLEHVNNDKRALLEIRRVLKKNGKIFLTVPNIDYPFTYDPINFILNSLFKKHINIGMWGWGHRRLYRNKNIISLLESLNFKLIKFENRSNAFIGLFLGYTPFISAFILNFKNKIFKNSKKKSNNYKNSFLYKLFNLLNIIDKRYFYSSKSINLCFIAIKK